MTVGVSDGKGGAASQSFTITVAAANHPPVITSAPVVSGTEAVSYRYQLVATDPDGDVVTFSLTQAPAGMTITNGAIAWTPSAAQVGAQPVTVGVSDGKGGAVSQSFTITVAAANHAPVITSPPALSASEARPYTYQVTASDADGDPLTFTLAQAPAGMTISTTGLAAWTPTALQAGPQDVVVRVADGRGGVANQPFTIDVAANRAPTASAGGPYTGTTGQSLAFTGTATDPDQDPLTLTWDFGDGTPSGNGAAPTHTYNQPGDYTVKITADDSHGGVTSVSASAHVVQANRAPTANPGGSYTGIAGQAVSFNGGGSTDPDQDLLIYSWDFGDGSQPKGSGVSPTHTYSVDGTFVVSLTVDDSHGGTHTLATQAAIARAVPVNHPPTANAGGPYTGTINQAIAFTGAASTDPDATDTLTYSWDFGDGATGTGVTPPHPYTTAKLYTVTLTVSDGHDASDTTTITVAVAAPNRTPTANPGGPYAGEANVAVVVDGTASNDPDGDALAYSWDFGDSSSKSTDPKPSHIYSQAGTYTISLTVGDGRGGSQTATTTAAVTAVVDRAPPVVSLSGPKQALPGTQLMMVADATDNVGVVSVILDVNGADPVEVSAPPFQRLVTVPDFAAPGATLKIGATARDAAGNTGTAAADVTIVAEPDTVKPTVAVKVPGQAAPGAVLTIAATASDNVGVASVVLSANGTTFASLKATPYEATYVIPLDAPVGASLTFSAQAIDGADNRSTSSATVLIVQVADTTPPSIELTAPLTAQAGTAVPISATAIDIGGVESVRFFLDGTPIATVFDAPYTTVLAVPPGLIAGTRLRVEARAFDFSGLQTLASKDIDIVATGEGVVTGKVLDDGSGLPLEGADVALVGKDARGVPYTQTTVSDSHGRYVIHATEGTGTVSTTRNGWSALDRVALVKPQIAVELVDARLTTVAPGVAITALSGGVVKGDGLAFLQVWRREVSALEDPSLTDTAPGGPDVTLRIPPGALAANATMTLTPLSRQALAGLLPPGWTPVAIIDIAPHGTALADGVSLSAPNPFNLKAGTPVVFARWDEQVRAWRAAATSVLAQDKAALDGTVPVAGQYAWLVADAAPAVPPQPAAGDLIAGVQPALIPLDVTAVVNPQPRIIFYKPGVKSDVRGTVTTTGALLSSGTIIKARIIEFYQFVSQAELHLEPFEEDLVLYQIPGGASPVMAAGFPVSPSLVFEPLSLEKGVITVELRAPEEAVHEIALVGGDGGAVTAPTGERLDVAAGSVPATLPIEIRRMAAGELGAAVPPGFALMGAASISFASALAAPATLSIPRPAQAGDTDTFLFARMQELRGETLFVLVGVAAAVNDRLVTQTTLAGTDATFEGIRTPGRYVFLRAANPLAFAAGTVTGAGGTPFAGGLLTSSNLSIVSLSQSTGRYISAIALGDVTLSALDLQKTDSVSVQTTTSAPRQVVAVDLALAARPPTVTSVTPSNGAVNIALADPVIIHFSSPIDPATATLQTVQLTSDAGIVIGTLALTSNSTVATFRAVEALQPNTVYTLTLSQSIKDPFGRSLPSAFAATFTSLDTIAPPPPAAGSITATIPGANGKTTITATQGTAGAHDTVLIKDVTRGTVTPVVLDPNGGFVVIVAAGIVDKLQIVIRDTAGNETVSAIPGFRQVNADGSVSQAVTSAGGHIDGPAGIGVDVQSGTFPDGAVVTVTPVSEAEFPVPLLTDAQRQYFSFSGGLKLDYGGKKPQLYLNVSIPAGPNDNEANRWMVVRQMPYAGETLYDVADTARVIDGKVTTSSPPCPGVSAAAVYGFLKANQELSVLTGAGGVIRNPEALDAAFLLAAETVAVNSVGDYLSGLSTPGDIVAGMDNALTEVLLASTTFCVPVLSGKVTAVPNQVAVSVDPAAFIDADVELVVTNTSPTHPGQPRHFYRPFPARISIEGGANDPVSVQALALDGTARNIDQALVQKTSRSFVAVSIPNLVGDYRSIVVENLQTHKQLAEALTRRVINGQPAPVNVPLVKLLVEGTMTDPYDIYAVTTQGVKVPLTSSVAPYDAGGGNILFTAMRGTIDPTPDEIDAYNATLAPGEPGVDRQGGTTQAVLEIYHRDPVTNAVTAAGTFTLLDVDAGINKTADGGFQVTFDENVTSSYYLRVKHLNGFTDRTKLPEFRVTVVNHKTKATVRQLLGPVPAKNDTTVINVYGAGSATPTLQTSLSAFVDVDPSAPLQLHFSAPIERTSALHSVTLTVGGTTTKLDGRIVIGNDVFDGIDSMVTFIPKEPLPLGGVFRLSLVGVLDLLGRPLSPRSVLVTTYTPTVIGTYSETNIDGLPIPFDDVQVIHDTGPGGTARTSLVATSSNDNGFKLHMIDVSDPPNPVERGQAGGGHRTRRIAVQSGASLPLRGDPGPGCNAHVNSSTFAFTGNFAMGTASNTDDSSLMFYDVTTPDAPCTLASKKITTNPDVSGDFQHGTLRTLNLGAGGAAFLKTTTGYAAYMAIREVGIAAVDVGADIPDVVPAARQTEGLYSGDYTDVIAAAGDRLLALNNNYGSGSTLDVLDPNLSPITSVAVDTGSSSGGDTLAHQVAYASDILVDKNNDGQYDDSEVFAFAYVGGRAGITIVDVTDIDNPAPVATFPVGLLVRQVAVSPDGRRLYVGGAMPGGDVFSIVDVSNPFAPITNRIIYQRPYPEIDRVQVDPERPYVYVATNGGIDIIATEGPNLAGTISYVRYPVDIQTEPPRGTPVHQLHAAAGTTPTRGRRTAPRPFKSAPAGQHKPPRATPPTPPAEPPPKLLERPPPPPPPLPPI